MNQEFEKHFEESVVVDASAPEVFEYADDHRNFSSHMNKSSMMMAGSKMETGVDEGHGQKEGSHITMTGSIFGIKLFLDEVVNIHDAPRQKEWHTVGDLSLLVVDHYKLGFKIAPVEGASKLTVYIDYNMPKSFKTRLLGFLLGGMYAKWCVRQMTGGVKDHFERR